MSPFLITTLLAALLALGLYFIHRAIVAPLRDAQLDFQRETRDNLRALESGLTVMKDDLRDSLAKSHSEQLLRLQESQKFLGETLGERLEKSSQNIYRQLAVVPEVQKKLGELEVHAQSMAQMGREVGKLSDLLKPPKLRGGLGEQLLENLLTNILPHAMVEGQYQFRDGTKVDFVVHCNKRLLPIDSKFPIETWRRVSVEASDQSLRKQFERELRGHIDKVASYVKPQENTTEIAILYLPSEAVYGEIESAGDTSLFEYARARNVILASPTLTYIYLRGIAAALHGQEMERRSQEIIGRIGDIRRGFGKFQEDFERVGSSLRNASQNFDKALRRFDGIQRELTATAELSGPTQSDGSANSSEKLSSQFELSSASVPGLDSDFYQRGNA